MWQPTMGTQTQSQAFWVITANDPAALLARPPIFAIAVPTPWACDIRACFVVGQHCMRTILMTPDSGRCVCVCVQENVSMPQEPVSKLI